MRNALITTTSPLARLCRLGAMDRFFNDVWGETDRALRVDGASAEWQPAVDIRETDKELVVKADLPGVDPKDVKIHVRDGYLTLEGERKEETRREEGATHWVERFAGSFSRVIRLPDYADVEKAKAAYANGVLEITLPFAPKVLPRQIEISQN